MARDRERDEQRHEHDHHHARWSGERIDVGPDAEVTEEAAEQADPDREPNPPRTTTGPVTAPKFGSAGSGGAELEPGPERD